MLIEQKKACLSETHVQKHCLAAVRVDVRDACVLLNEVWIKALAVVSLGQLKSGGEGL